MMLTTPATAPEPQAAEAPPVTISTRPTRLVGTKLRLLSPMKRRPLTRVRVRARPRPRSSTGAVPARGGGGEAGRAGGGGCFGRALVGRSAFSSAAKAFPALAGVAPPPPA